MVKFPCTRQYLLALRSQNISDYDYDKVVFGSVVGTAVGRQFTRNVSVFDQSRSITYTWNPISETNLRPDPTAVDGAWNRNFPVGYVGVAFLESPGNPFDGIDNDDDWDKIGTGPAAIPNRGVPSQLHQFQLDKFHRRAMIFTSSQRMYREGFSEVKMRRE